jgi:hypothetical protein
LSGLKVGEQVIADNLIKMRPGAEVLSHPYQEVTPSSAKAK